MTAGMAIQATTGLNSLPISPWAGLGVLAAWAPARCCSADCCSACGTLISPLWQPAGVLLSAPGPRLPIRR
jgi:hypothetical protein